MRFPLRWPLFLALGAAWLAADQVTKIAVDAAGWDGPVRLIPGLLDFVLRGNHGGAWGFLSDAPESFRLPFFVVSSLLAIVVLLLLRPRLDLRRPWADLAFPAILGGAVGNLVDRVRLGYVIDFIEVHVGSFTWPTFNVADIGITLGVLVLLFDSLLAARTAAESAEPAGPDDPAGEPDASTPAVPAESGEPGTAPPPVPPSPASDPAPEPPAIFGEDEPPPTG